VGSAGHVVRVGVSGTRNVDTIFHARVGPVRIPEKARQDMLHQTCILHRVGYAGHVVHFDAPGALNVDALLLMLGWDEYGFHKKHDGTR
jgi:hypothetical protein